MLQAFRRVFVTLLIFLFVATVVNAEETGEEDSGSSIDVMGQVVDHNKLSLPGYQMPLPRILLVDGQWFFYKSTESAVASGQFVEQDHALVPADGREITIDMSITSHLVYVWFGVVLTLIL